MSKEKKTPKIVAALKAIVKPKKASAYDTPSKQRHWMYRNE